MRQASPDELMINGDLYVRVKEGRAALVGVVDGWMTITDESGERVALQLSSIKDVTRGRAFVGQGDRVCVFVTDSTQQPEQATQDPMEAARRLSR